MLCEVRSLGLSGISGYEVRAECDLSAGLPAFEIVGLPDAAVKEARDRVRAAIKNCGFTFPVSRITVNLAPANQRKGGTVYDLPILAGILAAGGASDGLPQRVRIVQRGLPELDPVVTVGHAHASQRSFQQIRLAGVADDQADRATLAEQLGRQMASHKSRASRDRYRFIFQTVQCVRF